MSISPNPKRWKLLEPNEPIYPTTGTPANEVTNAVAEDTAPAVPHIQLAPKKTFETGFGEK